MSAESDTLLRALAQKLADLAGFEAEQLIQSSTLREALRQFVEQADDGSGDWVARLNIPHYWAVYYHDGRRGFGVKQARKLVYFANPGNDPRIAGGYPVLESDIRRLTKQEYLFGLEKNREAFERGAGPYMYVVDTVGPAEAHPFFSEGMVGFEDVVDSSAFTAIDEYVRRIALEDGTDTQNATFRL